MFVIMMNDSPIATAASEVIAQECCKYMGRLFDVMQEGEKHQFEGKRFIYYREVPEVASLADSHKIYMRNGGSNYTHILNILQSATIAQWATEPEWVTAYKLRHEDALKMFREFRKTYPVIDEFIERARAANMEGGAE